jgi:hypothetical protein
MTIQERAQLALTYFARQTRADGFDLVTEHEDAPQWITKLVADAHGEHYPDIYRYQFLYEALRVIAAGHGAMVARTSPHELVSWLASRDDRYIYVDEAVAQQGHGGSVLDDLRAGMLWEKTEVLYAVRGSLEDHKEEL